MLWNFIKISIRNIRRHKLFSAINIVSLTLSITICLAVLLLIKNQTDFDTFHPHPERTYRLITEATYENGATERFATAPLPLGETLEQNYPLVESGLQIRGRNVHYPVRANGKQLDASAAYSEPDFFNFFGFELEQGNPATALSEPKSVVLTPETARRFFGNENPMGKTFTVKGSGDYTVTGILKNNLDRTHLEFDFLASLNSLATKNAQQEKPGPLQDWGSLSRGNIYVLLIPNSDSEQLSEILSSISQKVSHERELERNIQHYAFEAQSLSDVSPGEELRYEMGGGKVRSAMELLILSAVALVVLLMACFNYTNLSIARALKRSREVGIYKLLGAYRTQIIGQFVVQSTIVAGVSLILAYAILPFIPLPPTILNEINTVTPDTELISWFVLFSVFTGILAGGLPAWLLSSLKPSTVLKNIKSMDLIEGLTLRKALVTVQFAISIILLITATVVYQQSQYAATTDYGFQQENIINLNLQGEVDPQLMKDELSRIPGVEQISGISEPFGYFSNPEDFFLEPSGEPIHGDFFTVDRNVIPNLDLELVAGQNFTEAMGRNPGNYAVVNEHFLTVTEWENPVEAIGETVFWRDYELEIIGVVKDFNYKSLSMPIRPLILHHNPEWSEYLNIRLAGDNMEDFTASLENIWEKVAPRLPLRYQDYDQAIYEFQSKEQTVASLGYYALIVLAIACLGLLGIVTYTVEVRTQEVGIRKVLGAGIANIVTLLSREFVLLLFLAIGIGLPVGYWIGQQFLSSYAYHISIGFGTLFTGIVIMGTFGLLVIGTQTWLVARQNPVESIRTE